MEMIPREKKNNDFPNASKKEVYQHTLDSGYFVASGQKGTWRGESKFFKSGKIPVGLVQILYLSY